MRLTYATRWGDDGTFVMREDGPVTLIRALARRTDVSKQLDLTLPVFPLTRSGWKPLYERDVFYLARLGAEGAHVLDVPFGPGDHESVYLHNIPEVLLNQIFRAGEALVAIETRTTTRPPAL